MYDEAKEMERWIRIIYQAATPEQRLSRILSTLRGVNENYDRMFSFDANFNVLMNPDFVDIRPPKYSSSLILTDSASAPYLSKDKVLSKMENEMQDFCFTYAMLRYLNEDLTEKEKAVIACKYFRACKRQLILDRYNINVRDYYNIMNIAEEKLIELWRLDTHDERYGIPLSKTIVDKRRTDRTGIKGGYLEANIDWNMQFYK
jgi:hypothetical protein